MHDKPVTVQPASDATPPPQFTDPKHQMYEGMLPMKDFSGKAKGGKTYVMPKVMRHNTPIEYMGKQVYSATDLKAEIMAVNKKWFKTQSVGTFIDANVAHQTIVIVKDTTELEERYPDEASLADKKYIIIGGVPHATVDGKQYVVLPPKFAPQVGSVAGKVMFPVKYNEKIPLLMDNPDSVEKQLGAMDNNTTTIVAVLVALLVLGLFFVSTYGKWVQERRGN
jgi:hypothetical protein